jgi:hypothetical protein
MSSSYNRQPKEKMSYFLKSTLEYFFDLKAVNASGAAKWTERPLKLITLKDLEAIILSDRI